MYRYKISSHRIGYNLKRPRSFWYSFRRRQGVPKVGKSIQVIVQQYIKCATVPCVYKAFHFFLLILKGILKIFKQ